MTLDDIATAAMDLSRPGITPCDWAHLTTAEQEHARQAADLSDAADALDAIIATHPHTDTLARAATSTLARILRTLETTP